MALLFAPAASSLSGVAVVQAQAKSASDSGPGVAHAVQTGAPRDEPLAVVPLELHGDWFIIEGRAERGPLRFVFDTGANSHGLTRAVASHLEVRPLGRTRLHGGSGSVSAWLVDGPDIYFGAALARRGPRVLVDDDFVTDDAGVRYDGVIGTELLAHYDALIDAPRGEIRFYEPGAAPARPDLASPIPVDDLGRQLLHFTALVNGREVDAILDTGAPYTLLNLEAARALGLRAAGAPMRLAPRGIGSRLIDAVPTRLATVQLGTAKFPDLDAVVADLTLFDEIGLSARPLVIVGAPALEVCPTLISRARGTISFCEHAARSPWRLGTRSSGDDDNR